MERPILFSGEMVRAILDGRKTQTRRVIKIPNITSAIYHEAPYSFWNFDTKPNKENNDIVVVHDIKCPYGVPGDTLWVKETFQIARVVEDDWFVPETIPLNNEDGYWSVGYREENPDIEENWRPSIFMPRWASRINLLVKDIRVERVREISDDDCRAEGVRGDYYPEITQDEPRSRRCYFMELWDSINAKRGHGFETNPWVWVVEFERIK